MGYLNFRDGGEKHLSSIKGALRRRDLQMDENDDWEIHGPHQNMNYVVYIGKVYESLDQTLECSCAEAITTCGKHRDGFYVAIYPRAVYAIDEPPGWRQPKQEDRIPVKKRE